MFHHNHFIASTATHSPSTNFFFTRPQHQSPPHLTTIPHYHTTLPYHTQPHTTTHTTPNQIIPHHHTEPHHSIAPHHTTLHCHTTSHQTTPPHHTITPHHTTTPLHHATPPHHLTKPPHHTTVKISGLLYLLGIGLGGFIIYKFITRLSSSPTTSIFPLLPLPSSSTPHHPSSSVDFPVLEVGTVTVELLQFTT